MVARNRCHPHHSTQCHAVGFARPATSRTTGAPDGLVQIVTGYGDTGAALVRSGLGKLIFVGSTEVGRRVLAASAETLTPVTMELGGKDAFVVTDDVDLRQVWRSHSQGASGTSSASLTR